MLNPLHALSREKNEGELPLWVEDTKVDKSEAMKKIYISCSVQLPPV